MSVDFVAMFPADRRGRRRATRLTVDEQRLYRWILRRFAEGRAPTAAETRAAATDFGLDPETTLTALARDDLVHTDDAGRPSTAYPFSATSRGHAVTIAADTRVEAMCALDALGIARMVGEPIEIHSRDPLSGTGVTVRVRADGQSEASPVDTVLLVAASGDGGPSFKTCCDVINFFESTTSAERYLEKHTDLQGAVVPLPEAIELSNALFGDLLKDDERRH